MLMEKSEGRVVSTELCISKKTGLIFLHLRQFLELVSAGTVEEMPTGFSFFFKAGRALTQQE